ncbi:hypothetical protein DC347_17930 [Pseudarthrobacter sp. AG30]|uniref:hypothetical protein n=1 Tax=Pseudarthrobacter sp. AG30 TaxID=2249742 RepID=UPI000D6E572D|nr:hypothetical protein [Pseudarthrobacter sp. AG30]RAX15346.1 hypothetical protein DC347_17930 [Pseudarthrobacter sp. AG30]
MNTAKDKDMDVALNLSKLLVNESVANDVIEIVGRYATSAEFNSRANTGTKRWDLTWPGETREAQKEAVQSAAAELTDHGYRILPRP